MKMENKKEKTSAWKRGGYAYHKKEEKGDQPLREHISPDRKVHSRKRVLLPLGLFLLSRGSSTGLRLMQVFEENKTTICGD